MARGPWWDPLVSMANSEPCPSGPSRMTTWHQEFFAAVGKWPWLASLNDSVTEVVQPVYDRFRGNLAVELLHGGRWAGHALHPALSDLPIGFWSGSLLLDMVGDDTATKGKLDAAGTLSAAGLAAAVATAVTGVADWTVSDGEDRRVGLFHGLLNGAATALQGRFAGRAPLRPPRLGPHARHGEHGRHHGRGLRRRTPRAGPRGDGQPGGEPHRAHALGEDRLARRPARPRAKGVDVEGRKVLLYRDDETVYAIDDVCSHAGALLSRGPVVDCVVTCPLHESQFDVRDGHIVRGPAHHPQPALPSRVRNGWVEVRGTQPGRRRANT